MINLRLGELVPDGYAVERRVEKSWCPKADEGPILRQSGNAVLPFRIRQVASQESRNRARKVTDLVTERTLVLIDEPETHLHPPLPAAFIRAVSDLLIDRNGVAIIATHSPVVLQETPRGCVWKLRRSGHLLKAERPEIETFGENVGVLTREAFGLEVTRSGFHRELQKAVREGLTYEQVLDLFGGQLGGEARGIARALIAVREREGRT
jgi:hypothetical protein